MRKAEPDRLCIDAQQEESGNGEELKHGKLQLGTRENPGVWDVSDSKALIFPFSEAFKVCWTII